MGRDDIVSPCQVKEMIAEGKAIVIMDDYVLRLDSWLNRHPGGDLVIKHMIGRDATHEITV
jgi:delta8-fatty-acid desaturase